VAGHNVLLAHAAAVAVYRALFQTAQQASRAPELGAG
jgi:hypothetical protein